MSPLALLLWGFVLALAARTPSDYSDSDDYVLPESKDTDEEPELFDYDAMESGCLVKPRCLSCSSDQSCLDQQSDEEEGGGSSDRQKPENYVKLLPAHIFSNPHGDEDDQSWLVLDDGKTDEGEGEVVGAPSATAPRLCDRVQLRGSGIEDDKSFSNRIDAQRALRTLLLALTYGQDANNMAGRWPHLGRDAVFAVAIPALVIDEPTHKPAMDGQETVLMVSPLSVAHLQQIMRLRYQQAFLTLVGSGKGQNSRPMVLKRFESKAARVIQRHPIRIASSFASTSSSPAQAEPWKWTDMATLCMALYAQWLHLPYTQIYMPTTVEKRHFRNRALAMLQYAEYALQSSSLTGCMWDDCLQALLSSARATLDAHIPPGFDGLIDNVAADGV